MNDSDRKNIIAVGLFSGGNDSILAAKLISEQGFNVHLFHFTAPFINEFSRRGRNMGRDMSESAVERSARELGLKLVIYEADQAYYDMIRNPPNGTGRNVNPCIDCRIYILRKAREYMESVGGAFVFSGEVLNQRPMSQHRSAMRQTEKASGLVGKLLRPLTAKRLPETDAEISGLVDRSRLEGIEGRGRKRQVELMNQYGIKERSQSGGGCLLTDTLYSVRVRDLFEHQAHIEAGDYALLSVGRHFRPESAFKLVVARDDYENNQLEKLASPNDALLEPLGFGAPLVLLRGIYNDAALELAGRFMISHCSAGGEAFRVLANLPQGEKREIVVHARLEREQIESLRIG